MFAILIFNSIFALTEARLLDLKPSFSYLNFFSSFEESLSPIVIEGNKMFILAKECIFQSKCSLWIIHLYLFGS